MCNVPTRLEDIPVVDAKQLSPIKRRTVRDLQQTAKGFWVVIARPPESEDIET